MNRQDMVWKSSAVPFFSMQLSRTEGGFDTFVENALVEHIQEAFSGEKVPYVILRPSFVVADSLTNKTGRYHSSYYPYYCLGTTVYKQYDGDTASTIWTGTNATNTNSKLTNVRDTQNDRDQIIFVEGGTGKLVAVDKSTDVATELSSGPSPANPHVAELDGYLFVAIDGTDEIYNSDVNDVTTWDLGVNFIRSSANTGPITCLHRYKNYIIAFKAGSAEFFYDAGLANTSPLQRNDSLRMSVGCAYPWTLAYGDETLVWVGHGVVGNTPSVYVMTGGTTAQKISTPAIERQLSSSYTSYDTEADYRGWLVKQAGHTLYVLKTPTTTLVYDFDTMMWSNWTYNEGTAMQMFDVSDPPDNDTPGVYFYWYDGTNTYLGNFTSTLSQYDSYLGTNYPIVALLETPPIDLGSIRRKQISLMRLKMSSHAGYYIRVRWSDDDKATWSGWRSWSMGSNPTVRNLGQTRRRIFQFEFVRVTLNDADTTLSTLPSKLRFEGFEVEFREGVN